MARIFNAVIGKICRKDVLNKDFKQAPISEREINSTTQECEVLLYFLPVRTAFILAAIAKYPKNAEQKIRMSRKTTKAYLLYGEEDNADRRILCQHYWIVCNSGEYILNDIANCTIDVEKILYITL